MTLATDIGPAHPSLLALSSGHFVRCFLTYRTYCHILVPVGTAYIYDDTGDPTMTTTITLALMEMDERITTVRCEAEGVRLPIVITVYGDGSRVIKSGPEWAWKAKVAPNAAAKSQFTEAVRALRVSPEGGQSYDVVR